MRVHPFRASLAPVAGTAAAAVAAAAIPFLPATPDLYVHLLWAWEVARSLASGALPVWLPDLNAGFGSPGIRLYSPLGPLVEGAAALALGSAGAALRVVPVVAWGAFLVVLRRRRRAGEWALVLLAPPVLYSLTGRGAWSEFLAVPLLWWLLDAAVRGDVSATREGPVLAALWLVHAPTTLMAVAVMVVATAARRDRRPLGRAAAATLAAVGLTAGHWLPLASEMRLTDRAALTGGIFTASRNALGSPTAHAIDENIWLGWCAVALLVGLALALPGRPASPRTVLAVLAVGLASPLASPLYAGSSPLAFLQFPSRWLLVAAVLAAEPLARGLPGFRGAAPVVVALLPAVVLPWKGLVRVPRLTADTPWPEAGLRVSASFAGNPFLVDAVQNRPLSWRFLGENMQRFGERRALVRGDGGRARVISWAPLLREVEVQTPAPTRLAFRVLGYPFWEASLDGVAVAVEGTGGVPEVSVPVGRHVVALRWGGNPLTPVGWALAAIACLVLAWSRLRRAPHPKLDGAGSDA